MDGASFRDVCHDVLMVPKIRATHRENIDRRQVRGNSLGLLRGAERGWWDGAVQVRDIRRPFAPEVFPIRLYGHPRESVGEWTKPHDSAVFRHPPSVRYTCKTYLPVCGVPRRETPTQFQRFRAPYTRPTPEKGPHKPRNTPPEPYRTPGDAATASQFCSYIRSSPIRNR